MPNIYFQNVSVFYQEKKEVIQAVNDVTFFFKKGKINVLIGPSGCGKTTLLNCLNGKLVYEGKILFDDEDIENIPVQERKISYVSQDYFLYQHMNVYDNVIFPLRTMKLSREESDQRVKAILKKLGIAFLITRLPKQLSVGQASKVAIARALVKHNEVMLFDEALSHLDPRSSMKVIQLIKEVANEAESTVILVTNDLKQVMPIGEHFILMEQGQIKGEYGKQEFLTANDPLVVAFREGLK